MERPAYPDSSSPFNTTLLPCTFACFKFYYTFVLSFNFKSSSNCVYQTRDASYKVLLAAGLLLSLHRIVLTRVTLLTDPFLQAWPIEPVINEQEVKTCRYAFPLIAFTVSAKSLPYTSILRYQDRHSSADMTVALNLPRALQSPKILERTSLRARHLQSMGSQTQQAWSMHRLCRKGTAKHITSLHGLSIDLSMRDRNSSSRLPTQRLWDGISGSVTVRIIPC